MEEQVAEKVATPYDQIGGWLILVGLGVVLTPMRLLFFTLKDVLPALSKKVWPLLTTPGAEHYHPLWAPLLIFELVFNLLFIVFGIVIAILFFKKRKLFQKMMLVFLVSNLVLVGADYFVANLIPAVASQNDPESAKELFRTFVSCVIWIPYLLISKRVKGTFVH